MEFSKAPQILFNYTETDLHNPVTVKNTYTKSVSLEGTKQNCDALGHFYRLDRYQYYGTDMGAGFNPMVKTDFSLYVGGALYERGYFKLTSVDRDSSGNYTFQITLYGMLGSFFSHLTYAETEADVKLTLADLDYDYVDPGVESTLVEWPINKDEVYNAWGTITGEGSVNSARYRMIQYVPTYGGNAEDFDSEKVLVNLNGFPGALVKDGYVVDGVTYTGILNGEQSMYGYALGEFDGNLTPWVTTDLRSYLMQPAISMKYIILACGNPAVNGGFELDLDEHFFNSSNPYYNSWLTLPSFSSLNLERTGDGKFLSNAKVTKQALLGGDTTPAEVLISFAKLFGLYFYYDPTEQASNPTTCPNGVIHLMDRDTFFTEEVVNIDDLIDYSKKTSINPTVATSKWLSFDLEQIDSQANNDYVEKYGYDYGRQLVNTSYNYDLGTTNLYDGNVFKGGVMVREKNNLYTLIDYEDSSYAPAMEGTLPFYPITGRFTYKLFHKSGTEYDDYEFEVYRYPTYFNYDTRAMNNLGLKDYDCFPKLQVHTDDNSASDGSGVLLFLNGSFSTDRQYGVVDYYITDDVSDMAILNDDTPCFILTQSEYTGGGARIARKINSVPNFTRDLVLGGQQEGNIVHSWNFGHPQETFIPNVYSTSGDSIYDKLFVSYIRDMYDTNTKSFTAYVKLNSVSPEMLRKYYWFANTLWRLNKIKDYDVSSYDTTQCEFIRVQDPENYKLERISAGGNYRLSLDTYTIGHSGGTIGGTVYLQSGGRWYRGDVVHIEYLNGSSANTDSSSWVSPSTATGTSSNLTVTVPANPSSYTRYITIYVEYEDYPAMTATITQSASGAAPYLSFEYPLIEINADGGYIGSPVQMANLRQGVVVTNDSPDWIKEVSFNEGIGQMTARIEPNSGYSRTGHITLTATGTNGTVVSDTTQIDQSPGGAQELQVQPNSMTFHYNSTSGDTMYVTYGGTWTITTQDQ